MSHDALLAEAIRLMQRLTHPAADEDDVEDAQKFLAKLNVPDAPQDTESLMTALTHRVEALGPDPDRTQQSALLDWIAESFHDAATGAAAMRHAADITKSEDMKPYLYEAADYQDPAHSADEAP